MGNQMGCCLSEDQMAQLDTRPDRINRKQFKNTISRKEKDDLEKGDSMEDEII